MWLEGQGVRTAPVPCCLVALALLAAWPAVVALQVQYCSKIAQLDGQDCCLLAMVQSFHIRWEQQKGPQLAEPQCMYRLAH